MKGKKAKLIKGKWALTPKMKKAINEAKRKSIDDQQIIFLIVNPDFPEFGDYYVTCDQTDMQTFYGGQHPEIITAFDEGYEAL